MSNRDDGGRVRRRQHDAGRSTDEARVAPSAPGKRALTASLPFAAPETAPRNVVRGALGAVDRVRIWAPQLASALAAGSYGESARLSFEIRSAVRRAEIELAELKRKDPAQADRAADQIEHARERIASVRHEVAMLLEAAPVLEAPGAESADSEAAWVRARSLSNDLENGPPGPSGDVPSWANDVASMAPSLGLGSVSVRDDGVARAITEAKGARGVALADTICLNSERVRPGTAEGREVLAHELVHLAQSRLPRGAGGGRTAAEEEAARLAQPLARGGGSVAPRNYINLAAPAADADAPHANTTAPDPRAERSVAFYSQLGLAQTQVAYLGALVTAPVPERVDEARKDALLVKAALASLKESIKALTEAMNDLDAFDYTRFEGDVSNAVAVNEVKAEAKKLRSLALKRIDAQFAKNVVKGVHLWLQWKDSVKGLADGTREWSQAGPGKVGPYTLHPHVNQDRLVFYVAYHEARGQPEWIVGADDADAFASSGALYAGIARNALPGSENVADSQEDGARDTHVPSSLEARALASDGTDLDTGSTKDIADAPVGGPMTFLREGLDLQNGGSALNGVRNAHIRLEHYVKEAERVAKEILAKVDVGELDHLDGRDQAVAARNEAMREARSKMSPAARAGSRAIKSDQGRSVEQMVEHKTKQLIKGAAEDVDQKISLLDDSKDWLKYVDLEQNGVADTSTYANAVEELGARPVVSKAIIRSAGAPNPGVTWALRFARDAGTVAGTLGLLDGIANIADAEEGERLHVAAKELGGFSGGIVGGEAGAAGAVWIASLIVSGPSAPVILVVSLIGSLFGGAVGAKLGSMSGEIAGLVAAAPNLAGKALMPMGANITGGGFTGMMERNQLALHDGGILDQVEDVIFEIDEQVQRVERKISKAPDRESLEELQLQRLSLLNRREIYDGLYVACSSGVIDTKQLYDIVQENNL